MHCVCYILNSITTTFILTTNKNKQNYAYQIKGKGSFKKLTFISCGNYVLKYTDEYQTADYAPCLIVLVLCFSIKRCISPVPRIEVK